ncbi:MAG TPA: Uma2 family endonuclease [Isosphaeraceae bacterium]|jgi:Uma2 family endonuclease|nr:Uma2 family endonuclease [Isosphaeraceae bacterium]
MATVSRLMTGEEYLALPEDDGVHRELIRGELREYPMTTRGAPHCRTTSRFSHHLLAWLDAQPDPHGDVMDGEVRVRITRDPDTIVGIDAIYIDPELAARTEPDEGTVDGVPTLVVEVLSPSDTQEDIAEKVREYLAAGVPLILLADPVFRTIMLHRPGQAPVLFNDRQELTLEPLLPGFRVAVAKFFR